MLAIVANTPNRHPHTTPHKLLPVRRSQRVVKPSWRSKDSPPPPSPHTLHKNYNLNQKKALKKKLSSCLQNTAITQTNKSGNIIYEFSAGIFELYKAAAIQHFQKKSKEENYPHNIKFEKSTDKQGALVEYRIRAKNKTSKGGGRLRFTLSIFTTTCRALLNGKHTDLYYSDHADIISNIMDDPNVETLDAALAMAIELQLQRMNGEWSPPAMAQVTDGIDTLAATDNRGVDVMDQSYQSDESEDLEDISGLDSPMFLHSPNGDTSNRHPRRGRTDNYCTPAANPYTLTLVATSGSPSTDQIQRNAPTPAESAVDTVSAYDPAITSSQLNFKVTLCSTADLL